MIAKALTNCGPCNDVPTVRVTQIDCATGQSAIAPGTDCNTPSWVKQCDPLPGADCNNPAWVKSCDPPESDCTLGLAMNPITLEVVAVIACVSAGVPTFTQYNLDGSPYTGPQPVAIDKEWSFQTHAMCAAGLTVTRTDVFIDGALTPAYQIWQDVLGAVIPAPVAATYGACQVRRLVAAIPAHVCSGGVPAGFVGYDFDIPAQFPGATDASDLWLHIIEYPGNVYWIPPATTNPTTPIPVTDPSVQSHIDAALTSWGLTPGGVLWQVNGDNTITVWYAPTFDPTVFRFWAGVSTPDQYTGKEYPQIPATHQPPLTGGCSTCVEVQIEKYENADGSITEELYEIGTRNLVTLSPGQTLAFGPCPKPGPQPLIIKTGWQVITAPFSLADALALSGGSYISAFTVKQISGVGLVTGDTGSAPLDTAEIWSGSTGNNIDRLSTNIIFDPQSGAMRLMWHYV